MKPPPPKYLGLRPASPRATASARGASAKRATRPELLLRKALCRLGLRSYRLNVATLPGRPDIVFPRARLAIFCDGDFWHGRDLATRLGRLKRGHNAPYWMAKICGNVARDRQRDEELRRMGWRVLRYWETDIIERVDEIAAEISRLISQS